MVSHLNSQWDEQDLRVLSTAQMCSASCRSRPVGSTEQTLRPTFSSGATDSKCLTFRAPNLRLFRFLERLSAFYSSWSQREHQVLGKSGMQSKNWALEISCCFWKICSQEICGEENLALNLVGLTFLYFLCFFVFCFVLFKSDCECLLFI